MKSRPLILSVKPNQKKGGKKWHAPSTGISSRVKGEEGKMEEIVSELKDCVAVEYG